MSTESHLTSLGVTIQQANDFILSHINEPEIIFNTAQQFGITALMLSEITGFSTSDISTYFVSFGLNAADLDEVGLPVASLTNYLAFNDSTGALSIAALRENIIAATNPEDYFSAFNPSKFIGSEDGVFTPDELGTARLGNVAANTENIESLVLGTFIHVYKAIDISEALQFNQITEFLADSANNDDSPDFLALMDSVFSDPAPNPIFNDAVLVEATNEFGIHTVETIGNTNSAILFDSILNISA